MKSISEWQELREFGIDALTGEADALGMRLLCDLTKKGTEVITEFFGLGQPGFKRNWNSGDTGDPHIASMFLPRNIFADLAAFCLLSDGAVIAVHTKGGRIIGLYPGEEEEYRGDVEELDWETKEKKIVSDQFGVIKQVEGGLLRVYAPLNHPRVGFSCVHAMTGRTQ